MSDVKMPLSGEAPALQGGYSSIEARAAARQPDYDGDSFAYLSPPSATMSGDMTILIAALHNGNAVLAADGQVTEERLRVVDTRRQKIVAVTRDIGFGISGSGDIAIGALRRALHSDIPMLPDFCKAWSETRYPVRFAKWGILKEKVTKALQAEMSSYPDGFVNEHPPVVVMCGHPKGQGRMCVWLKRSAWQPVEHIAETGVTRVFMPEGMPEQQRSSIIEIIDADRDPLLRIRDAVRICAQYEAERACPRTNANVAILDWRAGFQVRWEDL